MPVVAVFDSPTLTRENYEESVRRLTDGGGLSSPADWPVEGLLVHVAGPVDGGFRVIDVWESAAAFGRFGEVLGPIMQEMGITDPPTVSDVHTFVAA